MPILFGHYRPIALLLVVLSAFASVFYLSVWSSILDPNHSASSTDTLLQKQQQQRARVRSKDASQPRPDLILEDHHHHFVHQIPSEQELKDGDTSTLKTPLPILATELRPSQPSYDESSTLTDDQKEQLVILQSVDRSQLTTIQRKQLKVLKTIERAERSRRKEEQSLKKEELRLRKEEQSLRKEEQRLRKEEKRLRKERKLERQRQLESEPFPALISTNNARVAALNTEAFARFCHPPQQQNQQLQEETSPEVVMEVTNQKDDVQSERKQKVQGNDVAFATYQEWMDYIHNKNTGHEQEIPILTESIPGVLDDKGDEGREVDQDQQLADSRPKKLTTKPRPQFLERPLHGWIVNMTALWEPCDRKLHSSAHCLAYLAQEHLYLVPSRESREMANRRRPKHREWLPDPDVEGLGVAATGDAEISDDDDGYNNDDDDDDEDDDDEDEDEGEEDEEEDEGEEDEEEDEGEMDDEESTASKDQVYPKPMDFHIFWRGPISDKLSLAAHAFLFTQPLDRSRLHLWIDSSDFPGGKPENYAKNPFSQDLVLDPIRQYVKIHPWHQVEQESFAFPPPPPSQSSENTDSVESTMTEGLTMKVNDVVPPVALSDEARFLILHRYGGMYLDADVLLLKDMSPFYDAGVEFAYEWSNTEMYNTAVLRMNKGSSVAKRILEAAKAKQRQVMEELELKSKHEYNHSQDPPSNETAPPEPETEQKQQQQSRHHHHLPKEAIPPKEEMEAPVEIKLEDHPLQMAVDTDGSLFAPPTVSSITPHRLVKREMRPNEVFHPARLRYYLRPQDQSLEDNGLTMMPVAVFDPLWLRVDHADLSPYSSESNISPESLSQSDKESKKDREQEAVVPANKARDREMMLEDLHSFPDAFSADAHAVCPNQMSQQPQGMDGNSRNEDVFSAGPEVFFMGAYTYHWHNNWHSKIESRSWLGLMRQAYDEFLTGERPNLYGEWFHD
ncbi:hypothetical protein EMPS_04998 [Entomortierella parvispora]|uniref:Glycosyltransferase family 32 protein n=1 Tax=Entomortierella parvispora TaxID=205924 RepID=A0A9P3LWB6_9FUNG|nr:hypothetical protein EMPS_04998 [Entomortierella parvispora]